MNLRHCLAPQAGGGSHADTLPTTPDIVSELARSAIHMQTTPGEGTVGRFLYELHFRFIVPRVGPVSGRIESVGKPGPALVYCRDIKHTLSIRAERPFRKEGRKGVNRTIDPKSRTFSYPQAEAT